MKLRESGMIIFRPHRVRPKVKTTRGWDVKNFHRERCQTKPWEIGMF